MTKSVKYSEIVIALFVLFSAMPISAFWEQSQTIESLQDIEIKELDASASCRIHDNNVAKDFPGLRRVGSDVWVAYLQENNFDAGLFKVRYKMYQFNNWYADSGHGTNAYNRDEAWSDSYDLSGDNELDCWGVSIAAFNKVSLLGGSYTDDDAGASRGLPSAYISYISQNSDLTKSVKLAFINHKNEVQFKPVASNSQQIDWDSKTKVVQLRDRVLVFWDAIGSSNDVRNIMKSECEHKQYEQDDGTYIDVFNLLNTEVVVQNIPSTQPIDFDVCIYPYIILPNSGMPKDYRGIICWRTSELIDQPQRTNYTIRAKGFEHLLSSGFAAADQSIEITNSIGQDSIQNAQLIYEPATKHANHPEITINWLRQHLSFNIIEQRSVEFYLPAVSWLDIQGNATGVCFLEQDCTIYSVAADQGFMRPTGIDYNSETNKVIMTQMANHRINVLEDPFANETGCWVAEFYNDKRWDTGSLTRIQNSSADIVELRQISWISAYQNNQLEFTGYAKNVETEDVFPVAQENVSVTQPIEVKELTMINDEFSSFFCFFITEDTQNGRFDINWVCDGLLYRDTLSCDRLTRPYDLEFIPPVWTPTPTPTGVTPLPTHTPSSVTPTPCPEGIWIADMAGHRIVRVNERGRVLAETYTEDLSTYTPTWSEYENFGVISPNDVSAAWDGSCWAIDWGRNKVIKIEPDGEIVARTHWCEIPDPEMCSDESELIHPVSIDCGGDPNTCFVADYEANRIYKLIYDGGDRLYLEESLAQYYRPKAVAVDRYYDLNNNLVEQIWVADRWSNEPTPAHSYTYTPIPTSTPTPSTPTVTPNPSVTPPTAIPPTPYPEYQRVSLNQFGQHDISFDQDCAIPIALSAISNASNESYCYVSDRDAGWTGNNKNYIRRIKVGPSGHEVVNLGISDDIMITRPVDVAPVGGPPTTPTPTNTPTPAATP